MKRYFILSFLFIFLSSCEQTSFESGEKKIQVEEKNFSYPKKSLKFTIGQRVELIRPIFHDKGNFVFKVSPPLPNGVQFDSSTGAFGGLPSQVSFQKDYTFTASSKEQEYLVYSFSLSLEVLPVPPSSIVYNPTMTFTSGNYLSFLPGGGGGVEKYSISPSLPFGLSFNPSTGGISGSPSGVLQLYEGVHFVKGENRGGSVSASFILRVLPQPLPIVSYSRASYSCPVVLGCRIPSPTVQPSSARPNTTFTISPNLPSGYRFNSRTGAITLPLNARKKSSPPTLYSVSAKNRSGTYVTNFRLETRVDTPSTLGYPSGATKIKDVENLSLSPSPAPLSAPVTYYSIDSVSHNGQGASLPAGISLQSSTGKLTGIPSGAPGNYRIVIRGSNSSGSATGIILLRVAEQAPYALTYTLPPFMIIGNEFPANKPRYRGSEATGFTYERILPSGLSLGATLPKGLKWDSQRGMIYGVPREAVRGERIRLRAFNGGGSSNTVEAVLNISHPAPSKISYPKNEYNVTICEDFEALPRIEGSYDQVTDMGSSKIHLDFPRTPKSSGLKLEGSTGKISGNISKYYSGWKPYTIRASNAAGFTETNLKLKILPDKPVFNLSSLNASSGVQAKVKVDLISCFDQGAVEISPQLPREFNLIGNHTISYTGDLAQDNSPHLIAENKYQFKLSNGGDKTGQKDFNLGLALNVSGSRNSIWTQVADFNGDGKMDIISFQAQCQNDLRNCVSAFVTVLLQKEDGVFERIFSKNLPMVFNFDHFYLVDINKDSFPDVIFYDKVKNKFFTLKNINGRDLVLEYEYQVPGNALEHIIYDGKQILASDGTSFLWHYSISTSEILPITSYEIKALRNGISQFAFAKIDGDEFKDLIILDRADNTLCPVRALSKMSFEDTCQPKVNLPKSGATKIYSLNLGGQYEKLALVYRGREIQIANQSGDRLQSLSFIDIPSLKEEKPYEGLHFIDGTGDGKVDILTYSSDGELSTLKVLDGSNLGGNPTVKNYPQAKLKDINAGNLFGSLFRTLICYEKFGDFRCRIPLN